MSALAGIFKFDPRVSVVQAELAELAAGIDRVGPDGGGEHLAANLGMAYRAFHTTPESHFESQPLVRDGCILAWDGRLDNREEIRTRVGRKYEWMPTDLDVIFAAYQEWGSGCFAELLGDWVLALWDEAKQMLTLARDYIGVRRLFYRLDQDGIAWCTTIEPLVLTSSRKLHIDPDYLAGCLYPRPPVENTAYREIRSVAPASFLTFQRGGKQTVTRYWNLNPDARIRYSADSEYEAHFREVFRECVRRRLRADRTILSELSGGIDSSSIVCMADNILESDPSVALETLSYYSEDEPGGDERPYFTLIEQKRGRVGHHVSTSSFADRNFEEPLTPLPIGTFAASPGYFMHSLRWESMIQQIHHRTGARVILSGLGGDELLGGVQYEAPELADSIWYGQLLSFARSTYQWSLARRKTMLSLLRDVLWLLRASRSSKAFLPSYDRVLPWSHLRPPDLHVELQTFARWGQLAPSQLFLERVRYGLAAQLTCTPLPLVGCTEVRYPYLDRSLYAFIASIPRTQVLQAGHRRHLMRRALRGITPEPVLQRTTKWFGQRSILKALQGFANEELNAPMAPWISDGLIVDLPILRSQLTLVQHGVVTEILPLLSAIAIEFWLRSQLSRNTVDLSSLKKHANHC